MLENMVTAESLFQQLKSVLVGGTTCQYPLEKCAELAPTINAINALKKEKNAVILAHSYVTPEIIYGVSDYHGDSYGLSLDAQRTDADIIVFCAVRFMADTAKILNPKKQVLIPSSPNGCTLADSIDGQGVAALRQKFPDYTFVCYINTTAEVKAYCDVCVTSSNVYDVVERIPNKKIFFLPDRLMAQNIIVEMGRRGVEKHIEFSDGVCYVHEEYDPEMIEYMKLKEPDVKILSHPECNSGVLQHSDFVGSTSQMIQYVRRSTSDTFFMLTECGLTSRLQVELPEKKFVGSCTQCRYMKANTLEDILQVLESPKPENIVHIEPAIREKAAHCIQEMFRYTQSATTKPVGGLL